MDRQTLEDFESDLKGNLYRLWNRMSSGSYFPPPVKAVAIPKKHGGERILGVPTVADRVAQMVVKKVIEPGIEACFLPDFYGYRPGKSALDAVGVTRERCWKYDWVLEFDIQSLRKGKYPNTQFDFLGYTFRPRRVKNRKRNSLFVSFTPAVSKAAVKAMRETTRKLNYRNRTELSLADISRLHNPILRGWLEHYGKFCRSAMYPVLRHFNRTLVAWAMRKYKRLKDRKTRASRFLEGFSKNQPHLFVHWQRNMAGPFA